MVDFSVVCAAAQIKRIIQCFFYYLKCLGLFQTENHRRMVYLYMRLIFITRGFCVRSLAKKRNQKLKSPQQDFGNYKIQKSIYLIGFNFGICIRCGWWWWRWTYSNECKPRTYSIYHFCFSTLELASIRIRNKILFQTHYVPERERGELMYIFRVTIITWSLALQNGLTFRQFFLYSFCWIFFVECHKFWYRLRCFLKCQTILYRCLRIRVKVFP